MVSKQRFGLCAVATALIVSVATAVEVPITSFQADRDGVPFVIGNPNGYSTFEEVVLQDPQFSTTTLGHILAKGDFAAVGCVGCVLPGDSLEETYVDNFFGGANGTDQALVSFWSWSDATNVARWAHITTRQPPNFPSPGIHLGGKVKFRFRIESAGFSNDNLNLAIALMIRETGSDVPLGYNAGLTGAIEFVGVSGLDETVPANPTPQADALYSYAGPTVSGDNNFLMVEFNLPVLDAADKVFGWTSTGGNGTLDGTRGALEGLVVMPMPIDTGATFRDVVIILDEISFESPVDDTPIAPRLGLPIVDTDTVVRVNDVLYTSTNVSVEIDRAYDAMTGFTIDETYDTAVTMQTFTDVTGIPALDIGDAVRANQTNSIGTGPYSSIIVVTPPPVFTITLSLDEDGNLGVAPADFEYVGATTVDGTATPRGHAVFGDCATWQNVEFSLTGGDPVISFAGGNGQLTPDGGQYNIDAIFLSSDNIMPSAGPFRVYIDHVYYRDAANVEQIISNADVTVPFPLNRGQSSPVTAFTSVLTPTAFYDGTQSNRIDWTWGTPAVPAGPGGIPPAMPAVPIADGNNVIAPFRPGTAFPDTATAVGMWLLVEDCAVADPVRPNIVTPVVGNAPTVTINGLDAVNTTSVSLYVNDVLDSTLAVSGVTSFDFDPLGTLAVGNILTATHTTGAGTSDPSLPKPVTAPGFPTMQSPLIAGQTSVTVSNLLTAPQATASQVRVYRVGTVPPIGTAAGGAASAVVAVPTLQVAWVLYATQVVNGVESAPSGTVAVGTGVTRRVVINEFQYDDSGVDDREFIEIYNAEPSAVDISGWIVRSYDAVPPPGDDNVDYTIPTIPPTILAAGDYWVLGQGIVPNVDQALPAGERFENDNEITEIIDENGVVVDSIITERNKGPVSSAGETGIWGNFQSIDDPPSNTFCTLSRYLDGRDTNLNGRDFGLRPATPGTTNNSLAVIDFYRGPDVDLAVVGSRVAELNGSFDDSFVVDPGSIALLDGANDVNPYAIPPSPQGGNCVIAWDPSGGGNNTVLDKVIGVDGSYDIWVYVDTALVALMTEQWQIGLAGTADPVGQQNNVLLGANGSTGVSWRYVRTATTVTLALVDHSSDGGALTDWTVLGTLDLVARGVASGWYRLAIHVCGRQVTGVFDNVVIRGDKLEDDLIGTFYIGYREDMAATPTTLRPPTIDLRVADDCNGNTTDDLQEIADGAVADCNCNGVPDACDLSGGMPDVNGNSIPDECELGACCHDDGTCTVEFEAGCPAGYVCDVNALRDGTGTFGNCGNNPGGCCYGDEDGNGTVNAGDRGFISANIGQTAADLICLFDMDGNNTINAGDRGFVSAQIGQPCQPLPDWMNGSGCNHTVCPDPRFPVANEFRGAQTDCAQCGDACADSLPLAATVSGNNCDQDPTDDAEAPCQANSGRDVWYTFTAGCTGALTVDTIGSATLTDTVITVYDGCGGTVLACSDDEGPGLLSQATFASIQDTQYLVRVSGFSINCGQYTVNVACVPTGAAAACTATLSGCALTPAGGCAATATTPCTLTCGLCDSNGDTFGDACQCQ